MRHSLCHVLPRIMPGNTNLKTVGLQTNKLRQLRFTYTKNREQAMICLTKSALQRFDSRIFV